MKVNVKEFLADAGITEALYPGKRFVQPCRQEGEYKSHCVVLDWRDPAKLRVEVKPGLSGKDLAVDVTKNYPICFQTPTFVEIEIVNDNKSKKDDDEEEGETGKGKKGKSGGTSKGQKKGLKSTGLMNKAFSDIAEGKIPAAGKITEMVVMGVEVAAEAYDKVFQKLTEQINHAKVIGTELLAQAGKFVTKYTPPSFMERRGDEDEVYNYDALKNENIGYTGPAIG